MATKTITKRSSIRNVDAYRRGGMISQGGEFYVITDYRRNLDDQGSYEHTMTLRPATEEEARTGKIALLRHKISIRIGGPDDDRDREAFWAETRRLDNEIRALEGRPSIEDEQAEKKAAAEAEFAAAWAGTAGDRLAHFPRLANRAGLPLHGKFTWISVEKTTGISYDRIRSLINDEAMGTDVEFAALAPLAGLTVEQLRDGSGEAPTI